MQLTIIIFNKYNSKTAKVIRMLQCFFANEIMDAYHNHQDLFHCS